MPSAGSVGLTAAFRKVDLSARPGPTLPAELFGYVPGASTGAEKERPSLFRAADGGTVFLNEIGNLDEACQLMLLRVLESREVTPIGWSGRAIPVDVRVVFATSAELEHLVSTGRRRPDLYQRLNRQRIEVPALRDRIADIPLIARAVLERDGDPRRLSEEAISVLLTHD